MEITCWKGYGYAHIHTHISSELENADIIRMHDEHHNLYYYYRGVDGSALNNGIQNFVYIFIMTGTLLDGQTIKHIY